MNYLLPNDNERLLVDLKSQPEIIPKYLLFRDKEPLEGDDDFFAEPAYFAEGWIEGVYLDDGLSGKQ
ncbi:MAG: hypothetical protein ACI8Q1_003273, partial [Parvicella sp.]